MVARRCRAYTLLEVIGAFAILVTLGGALTSGSAARAGQVADAYEQSAAAWCLHGVLEQLRDESGKLAAGELPLSTPDSARRQLPGCELAGRCRDLGAGLFEVVVELSWRRRGSGDPRQLELETRILVED